MLFLWGSSGWLAARRSQLVNFLIFVMSRFGNPLEKSGFCTCKASHVAAVSDIEDILEEMDWDTEIMDDEDL